MRGIFDLRLASRIFSRILFVEHKTPRDVKAVRGINCRRHSRCGGFKYSIHPLRAGSPEEVVLS